MKDYQQRQDAIQQYLQGVKIAIIARSMGKSRKWVHTWIRRYKNSKGAASWFEDDSKAPKNIHKSLPAETEQQIVIIRNDLMKERMSQIGAISIQYECERRGIKPPPAIWTINRVIAKHGLIKQVAAQKKPTEYPDLFYHTHQMDLVGPRYIKGDGKFYSINLIDITTHSCYVRAVHTKSSQNIVEAIALFWQTHGMPDALQMDNELAFRGSNRYPRSFGSVIRFALNQGVAPVFIPTKEPWRNGIIEKFNDTYTKKLLQVYNFKNFEDLCIHQQSFMDFHNAHHRYSSQGHKTPNEMKALMLPPIFYRENSINLKEKIPLSQGCIYFIRYIRSDLKLYMPNEVFILPAELKYSYVIAEINVINQNLIVRQNGEIKQIFQYFMPIDY